MIVTEIFGIIGSVVVLISMLFKTSTRKGALCMRYINNIGSILFIVYGVLLTAWSTIALNIIMLIVNTYHIFKIHGWTCKSLYRYIKHEYIKNKAA